MIFLYLSKEEKRIVLSSLNLYRFNANIILQQKFLSAEAMSYIMNSLLISEQISNKIKGSL